MMRRAACVLLILAAACALRARAAAPQRTPDPAVATTRAVAYLAREVPAWRRDHPCYSCHNNGDAVRALVASLRRKHAVRGALDDTLSWLAAPQRWETNGGGEGGDDDKRLARIQFASAATTAAASLIPRDAVTMAATIVAADQQPDGSWRLDSSDSIGSPAPGLDGAIDRGRQYLLSEQLPDGSWTETTRPAGQTSYAQRISTTAWALLALLETEPPR